MVFQNRVKEQNKMMSKGHQLMMNIETKLTTSLLNKVKKVFPSLRKSTKMKGEFAIIEGIMDDTEANAMVKDINTIVRESFEGKLKDVEFAVVLDYNYMAFRAIKETARIV